MIDFPQDPIDGQIEVDYLDASNVVIWTFRADDNSWNAQEFGPGNSFTTRTDAVFLTTQWTSGQPIPTLPRGTIGVPEDTVLAKQEDLNLLFVNLFEQIDVVLDNFEATGGQVYTDMIKVRGSEYTQEDVNLANKGLAEANAMALQGDVQWAENVAGCKMRGLYEHQGGPGNGGGVARGYFKLFKDQSNSHPERTQDYTEVRQIWINAESLGGALDYVRGEKLSKGDLITVSETRTAAGGAYKITSFRDDWENEEQGDYYVLMVEPLPDSTAGDCSANSQATMRITPDITMYASTKGATFTGNVKIEGALEAQKALVVTLSGGGIFVINGWDNKPLLESRSGKAVQYKGEIVQDKDLCNKGYVDQQLSALQGRLAALEAKAG